MRTYLFVIVWFVMFAIVIIANIIYFIKIIPTLNKYGKNSSYEMLPSKQWKQIKEYRNLCKEHNLPKWSAYFMLSYQFVGLALLLLWILISK